MKTAQIRIFMDDGYPEASDYDNNYVGYEQLVSIRERKVDEQSTRVVNPAKVILRKRLWPCWPFR